MLSIVHKNDSSFALYPKNTAKCSDKGMHRFYFGSKMWITISPKLTSALLGLQWLVQGLNIFYLDLP